MQNYQQYNNITIEQYSNRKGFTLVEILMSLVLFGLVMAAAGGALYGVYNDWRRQRNYMECIENARWAMELMTNEIKQTDDATVDVASQSWGAAGSVIRLQFELPLGGAPNRVRYFRGNGAGFGPTTVLYRKSGAGLGPPADRQELANFIVDNPSGNPLFNWDAVVGLLTIELTVRPRPEQNPCDHPTQPIPSNCNYTLRTQVRPRN